jgi:hypothetical protein
VVDRSKTSFVSSISVVLAAAALALVVGCAGVPEAQVPAAELPLLDAPAQSGCPLGVPGSKVAFEETPGGGALTFTAPPERVEELRDRARRAFVGDDGRRESSRLPRAHAVDAPVDGGSRVIFTAVDPRDRDALRAKLKARAEDMTSGCSCCM